MNKIQFWIDAALMPYLLKDVPFEIVDKGNDSYKIEIVPNIFTINNIVFACKQWGGDEAIQLLTPITAAS
jgi:hypothetical protein